MRDEGSYPRAAVACVWGGGEGSEQDGRLPRALCLLSQAAFWCSIWRQKLAQSPILGQNALLIPPITSLSRDGLRPALFLERKFPENSQVGRGQVSQVWPLPLLFPLDHSLTAYSVPSTLFLSLVLGHKALSLVSLTQLRWAVSKRMHLPHKEGQKG